MKKSSGFGVFKLLCLCAIVAIASAVPTLAVIKNKKEGLEDNLKGNISQFQGVLTIWNVDTFEGGSQSKTVFLEEVATRFSGNNQGLYFLIKNITVEEMTHNFLNGVYPDIISFGFGVGQLIKPMLESLADIDFSCVRENVLNSGKISGEVKALGYLMGGYILATTSEKMLNAGFGADQKISAVLNKSGYDYSTKNGFVHVASVVLGENVYVRPNDVGKLALNDSFKDKFLSTSMYDAYVDFVGYNKGTILLGSHRDLFRLSGRIKVGKIDGVKIEFINNYTNLIQYAGVIKGSDEVRIQLSKKFVEYLVTGDAQGISTKIGMMNVIGGQFYESGEFMEFESALSGEVFVPNLFEW